MYLSQPSMLESRWEKTSMQDPDFPILHYRTERDPATGKVQPLCECLAKFSVEHRRNIGEL